MTALEVHVNKRLEQEPHERRRRQQTTKSKVKEMMQRLENEDAGRSQGQQRTASREKGGEQMEADAHGVG